MYSEETHEKDKPEKNDTGEAVMEWGKKLDKTLERMQRRERTNSTSIVNYMRGLPGEDEIGSIKRKREEKEKEAEEIVKRSNKTMRIPPGIKKMAEKQVVDKAEERKEQEYEILTILKEIKEEMSVTRMEIKEWKVRIDKLEDNWVTKNERMLERMNKMEERIRELESSVESGNKEEDKEMNTKKREENRDKQEKKLNLEIKEEVKKLKKAVDKSREQGKERKKK